MASGSKIKSQIVLEGEKEYNRALKDAARNIKTLQSEMKAETAELGKNATAQQKDEVRARSLQKQIAEQEEIVRICREQLEKVRAEYGDNADAVAAYEQKLNSARTVLAGMRNGLAGSTADTREGIVATNSLAESLERVSSAGESVSQAIESVFNGMLEAVKTAVTQLWELVSETSAKANNWTDLGSYYGSSAAQMQEWSNAIKSAGGNFDDFISLMNTFSFGGKEKSIAEWFGVSDANYTNDMDYALDVLAAMNEQKKKMMAGGTWGEAMGEIFGMRKSSQASWFISNWETILEKRENLAEEGYGMSEEGLATLNDVYITMSSIETKWNDIKSRVAEGLGTVAMDLMVNVEGMLDGISEYMNAGTPEEQEEALQKIEDNVREFCLKVVDAIKAGLAVLDQVGSDLAASDDPTTSAVGKILQGITQSLEWVIDNQQAFVTAMEAILGMFVVGKIAAFAGKLASIVTSLEALALSKSIQGLLGGAGGAAASGTEAAAGGAASGGVVKKIGAFLGSTGAKVLGGAAAFFGTLFENALTHQGNDDILDENGNLTEEARQMGWTQDENGNTSNEQYQKGGAVVAVLDDEYLRKNGVLTEPEDVPDAGVVATDITEEMRKNAAPEEPVETPRLTAEETAVLEDFWDAMRGVKPGDVWSLQAYDDAWLELEKVFSGQGELVEKMEGLLDQTQLDLWEQYGDGWNTIENLPDSFWTKLGIGGYSETGSGTDLSGLPAQIQQAVSAGAASGVSQIVVTLDGSKVGNLVAPYVSQQIARDFYAVN